MSVEVFASVLDKLRVLPKQISVREGTPPGKRYVLVSRGTVRTFKLLGVETPGPGVEADLERLPAGDYRITITGVAPEPALDGKELLIRTDVKGMSEIRVPFSVIPEDD
jgi:hypothetical protein